MVQDQETEIDAAQFQRLCQLVYQHCGITLHDGKQELVRARVARQLRTRPHTSAHAYLDEVMADPAGEEFASLIDALSTNLTSFFRESNHFTYLSRVLLPKILERKRREGANSIRGWSAACSTGEEPYTLAMTLLDALEGRGSWDVKLLATDISRKVLRVAADGRYEPSRVKAIPGALLNRYFNSSDGKTFEATQELRQIIRFNYLNLIDRWPFSGKFDFIFCRNVMIYFDKPTQEALVNRFWSSLNSGGVLFTGHSESLTGLSHRFGYEQPTIYIKS
jgi:chemotaxis protein methyltransferase CheR